LVHIEPVTWDDPRAVTLRAAMDEEMRPRYADRHGATPPTRMKVDPADLIVTLIAAAADGRGGRAYVIK
jgi:hypothetical protein